MMLIRMMQLLLLLMGLVLQINGLVLVELVSLLDMVNLVLVMIIGRQLCCSSSDTSIAS
jgi:hypothetical protein